MGLKRSWDAYLWVMEAVTVVSHPLLVELYAAWVSCLPSGGHTLTTLDFKSLTEVGEIAWTGLSAFTTISTDAGISSTGAVTISGTSLSTLQGINLKDVGSVDIRSNPN